MSYEPGSSVGDYRILASLGAGASGEVYRAEHVITRRVDAIKFLAHDATASDEEQQRFLREIQLQASLRHANIAAVHNAFRRPQGLALVMELAEGEPLDRILARGPVPLETGISYILQALAALQYAHERGVVHRDVKPGNMIVAPDGQLKLTDFGLARRVEGPQLTHSGAFTGSPYYMSPEQVVGLAAVDARCDIYAAGVVLYEIAAGRRPFEGTSAFEVMLKHRDEQPERPLGDGLAIGPALDGVILKAMAKDPAGRHPSAAAFRDALAEAAGRAGGTRPEGAAGTSAAAGRRKRTLMTAAAAAAALALCAAGGMAWGGRGGPVPPPPLPSAPGPPDAALMSLPAAFSLAEAEPAAAETEPPRAPVRRPAPRAPRQFVLRPEPLSAASPEISTPPAVAAAVPEPPPKLRPAPPAARAEPLPQAVAPRVDLPAPPPKRRHALWRAFGKVVRPLAKGETKTPAKEAAVPE